MNTLHKCGVQDCTKKCYKPYCKQHMPSSLGSCAKEGCKIKCSGQFCRYHVQVYNQCAHEGCVKNARKEYCHLHKPEIMAYRREYMRNKRGTTAVTVDTC